jgi:tripartite-type tricarboxylate transporter receptor subunit TctC
MKWLVWFALAALAFASGGAGAQDYPVRPIRLLVGFPAGGGVDIVARQIADQLSKQLGQTIVVENLGGAGGNIASSAAARAEPDGYTLLMANLGMLAINPALYDRLGFDPDKDLAPLARAVLTPLVAAVPAQSPARTMRELLDLARAKPGALNYGSGGVGNINHLADELLKLKTGIDIAHIPYRGSAPAMTDLVGGRIDLVIDGMNVVQPFVQAGTVRALAVTSEARVRQMPEVPTAAEAGVPDFVISGWQGLMAPARTPPAILRRLEREIEAALKEPALRDRLSAQGTEPAFMPAEAFGRFAAQERARWTEVVRAAGIKIQ